MKKLMIGLGIILLMSGCNLLKENNSDFLNSSALSSVELDNFAESTSSIIELKDSSGPESTGAGEKDDIKDSDFSNTTTNEILLVPQKADIENGFTLENDPVLQGVEERMRQAETIGIPRDVAIHFTGMVLNDAGKTQAIFILVNLTDMTMKNINMTISFSNTADDVILDKASFVLSEDRFGLFEPNTAMPVYVEIPEETKEIFNKLKDFDDMVYSIDSFDYEEI